MVSSVGCPMPHLTIMYHKKTILSIPKKMKSNKISSAQSLLRISRSYAEQWINKKRTFVLEDKSAFLLSMGYEKDIFAVFAYEFELLRKMKSVQARMISAMQMKSSATPQMKLNPPIRRRGGFHPTKLDFTHPQGWI